jgi:hypothetical protein
VLQWDSLSGGWWLWNYDAKAPSGIYSSLQASGKWDQIVNMGSPKWHELVPMPDGKVLDWVYHEGSYRLWNYVPLFSPNVLPTIAAEGEWGSKLSFDVVKTPRHELVAMPDGRVLDWVTKDGSYRLWNYQPQSKKDIFPGVPAEQGTWGKDKWGMSVLPDELVVMADGRILVWARATGEWSLWEYELPERPEGGSKPFQLDRWFAEADPLSKVISMSLYATLTKPRPPVSRFPKDVASLVSGLTPAERRRMTDRLKQIRAHLKVVDAALKKR